MPVPEPKVWLNVLFVCKFKYVWVHSIFFLSYLKKLQKCIIKCIINQKIMLSIFQEEHEGPRGSQKQPVPCFLSNINAVYHCTEAVVCDKYEYKLY